MALRWRRRLTVKPESTCTREVFPLRATWLESTSCWTRLCLLTTLTAGSSALWSRRWRWSSVSRRDLLYWILPPFLCLLVFYRGLFCWFQQDDFSWLRLEMHSFRDFWRLLVEPQAQGTIRPLSERFFFIAFRRLFDLNAF